MFDVFCKDEYLFWIFLYLKNFVDPPNETIKKISLTLLPLHCIPFPHLGCNSILKSRTACERENRL